MPASPNILNYFIGKGILSFTPDGGSLRDLGNAPSFEVVPTIEKLDHFESRSGVKAKDRSVAVTVEGQVNITLDEITPDNLSLALFGPDLVVVNTAGNPEFNILSSAEIKGKLVLTGTNEIGNQFLVTVESVSFTPSAGFNFISEEFSLIELEGEMLKVGGIFGTVEETLEAS